MNPKKSNRKAIALPESLVGTDYYGVRSVAVGTAGGGLSMTLTEQALKVAADALGGTLRVMSMDWSETTGSPVWIIRSMTVGGVVFGVLTAVFLDGDDDEPTVVMDAFFRTWSIARTEADRILNQ